MCSLTDTAYCDRITRLGDDLGDCLGRAAYDESDDTLGEQRRSDMYWRPVESFLKVNGILELACCPEAERE